MMTEALALFTLGVHAGGAAVCVASMREAMIAYHTPELSTAQWLWLVLTWPCHVPWFPKRKDDDATRDADE